MREWIMIHVIYPPVLAAAYLVGLIKGWLEGVHIAWLYFRGEISEEELNEYMTGSTED